jgi:beta-glucuronidase
MLYPQNNHRRLAIKLDGIWSFKKDQDDKGVHEKWFLAAPSDAIPMPVPAAFNEMTPDMELRDYYGAVWYFTEFHKPCYEHDLYLRFGAAVYHSRIYVNGHECMTSHLGKLPFDCPISRHVREGRNFLAVRIDTRLSWQTLPPGARKEMGRNVYAPNVHGSGNERPEYHFDFLNSGGLLRSVWLLGMPGRYIRSIQIQTIKQQGLPMGIRPIVKNADGEPMEADLRLLDRDGAVVAEGRELIPDHPRRWSVDDPYLYRLQVQTGDDFYEINAGLRCVEVTKDRILLNGQPVYLSGCGMHEDFHLVGQGHSDARMVKDLTLLKAMGATSFRTSHYPYDEAVYDMADRLGLLVINETAAVGLNAWGSYPCFTNERCNEATLAFHKEHLRIMVQRDNHHPSVIMWSLANEVACYEKEADAYFKELFAYCRAIDPEGLPVTVVQSSLPPGKPFDAMHSNSAKYCDVICWNRYYAWYGDCGHLEDIQVQLRCEAEAWRRVFPDKPIMMTEFGADAIAGMHSDPPVMFSEEYQQELIRLYCEEFDRIPYVVGEHVWNFADFMTKQGVNRVMGNRKGIHTRERQPKLAAHYMRKRWRALSK